MSTNLPPFWAEDFRNAFHKYTGESIDNYKGELLAADMRAASPDLAANANELVKSIPLAVLRFCLPAYSITATRSPAMRLPSETAWHEFTPLEARGYHDFPGMSFTLWVFLLRAMTERLDRLVGLDGHSSEYRVGALVVDLLRMFPTIALDSQGAVDISTSDKAERVTRSLVGRIGMSDLYTFAARYRGNSTYRWGDEALEFSKAEPVVAASLDGSSFG